MTVEQIRYKAERVKYWKNADSLVFRDMGIWRKHHIDKKLAEYLKAIEESESGDRMFQLFKRGMLRYEQRRKKYSAAIFFEKFCGMRWGGAVLMRCHHDLIVGGDIYKYYRNHRAIEAVTFASFDTIVADMTVWKDGKMLQIPVWCGYVADRDKELPEAVSDVELCSCFKEDGKRKYFSPVMLGYETETYHSFDNGKFISWDIYEQKTRDFIDRELGCAIEAELERKEERYMDCYDWDNEAAIREAFEGNWAQ